MKNDQSGGAGSVREAVRPGVGRSPVALCLLVAGASLGGCGGWSSLIGRLHEADSGTGGTGGTGMNPGPTGTGGGAVDAGVSRLGGSYATGVPDPHPPITSASKVDLLFLIDDSASMGPLQAKMQQRLADFMNVMKGLPDGLPSLHIAVVSSSLGAGVFGNVPGCLPGGIGNLNGEFQHSARCTMLPEDQHFIIADRGMNNFSGDITDAFSCITDLGANGCGFEHQFEAIRYSLQRALNPADATNGGFLRPDAFLGIVLLTNEDDCSVPADSRLFDPNQQHLSDWLGGLQSYRCNEFGHLCGGQPPPHSVDGPVTFAGCRSAEDGNLVTVAGMVAFLKSLKSNPSLIFVAALAGPVAPYTVAPHTFFLGDGTMEEQPQISHSCTQSTAADAPAEYADPAIRIAQLVRAFGPNGLLQTICADDFQPAMQKIANSMVGVSP